MEDGTGMVRSSGPIIENQIMRIYGFAQITVIICLFVLGVLVSDVMAQNTSPQSQSPTETLGLFPDVESSEAPSLMSVKPRGGNPAEQQPTLERNEELPNPIRSSDDQKALMPYGAQLFAKSNFIDKSLGVNASYTIAAGDKIALKMWGARIYEAILIVDVQGNIFIPEVGPVHIDGVRNSQLNAVVSSRVAQVFTNNVKVYTNLLGAQPIGVYVAGNVKFPGQIPGARGDSILYFLSRAGGIEEGSGSYRNITVRRRGKSIANVDLYEFMVRGDLPDIEFMDKDTIVVHTQAPSISVIGEVRNSYRYEIDTSSTLGGELLALASPKGIASHVLLKGVRNGEFINEFLSLDQLMQKQLNSGDVLEVVSDQVSNDITVSVSGNSGGASRISVRSSTVLGQVANLIQTDPLVADLDSIYLRRKSVADRQKLAIEQSLYELQRNALTASSSSATGSLIREKEAQLIDRFVSQARSVEPEGRIVLSGVDWSKVHLEDGDEIVIPQKTELVFITGEVRVPQTVLWNQEHSPDNYIEAAGGVSNRGDGDRLIIIRTNGSVQDGSDPIQKGDHIMVLPTYDTKYFALFKDLIEVMYRVALSAAVVLDANN